MNTFFAKNVQLQPTGTESRKICNLQLIVWSLVMVLKMLEYRIIAINKAGDGKPSNTAMVVL